MPAMRTCVRASPWRAVQTSATTVAGTRGGGRQRAAAAGGWWPARLCGPVSATARPAARTGQHPPPAVAEAATPEQAHGCYLVPSAEGAGTQAACGAPAAAVHVLWDLDNKACEFVRPRETVLHIRSALAAYGTVVHFFAAGNQHTFKWEPQWLKEDRRLARERAEAEAAGQLTAAQLHRCDVCGRTCRTLLDLRAHVEQLHLLEARKRRREQQQRKRRGHKRLHADALRAKEAAKFEKVLDVLMDTGWYRSYHSMLVSDLLVQGVKVVQVTKQDQAADHALMFECSRVVAQGAATAASGAGPAPLQVLVLISDDRGFEPMLTSAAAAGWLTLAVCGKRTCFPGAHATVSWQVLQQGRYGAGPEQLPMPPLVAAPVPGQPAASAMHSE